MCHPSVKFSNLQVCYYIIFFLYWYIIICLLFYVIILSNTKVIFCSYTVVQKIIVKKRLILKQQLFKQLKCCITVILNNNKIQVKSCDWVIMMSDFKVIHLKRKKKTSLYLVWQSKPLCYTVVRKTNYRLQYI